MVSEISKKINVAGFDEDAIADGPGLRFVLFVQGCPHHCLGCHNPQTHEFGTGLDMTVDDLYTRIRANPLQTGITFSGGEPFSQPAALADLAARLKADGYDVAVYTGFVFEDLLSGGDPEVLRLLQSADVLIDGPFVMELRDRQIRFRGSTNQRILDVRQSLSARKAIAIENPDWNV